MSKFFVVSLVTFCLLLCSCGFGVDNNAATFELSGSGKVRTLTATFDSAYNCEIIQQLNYYNNVIVQPSSSEVSGGAQRSTYKLDSSKHYSYRFTESNKMDTVGYIDFSKPSIKVKFQDKPKGYTYDYTTDNNLKPYQKMSFEDSLLLNVSSQNFLHLGQGDSYQLRPYRYTQIVDDSGQNIIAQPAFNYLVKSGNSVSISSSGEITAVAEGVSIISVSYNAVDCEGVIYNSSHNEAVVVVQVGGQTFPMGEVNGGWDSEFDTVYFLGDSGEFAFSPNINGATVSANGKEVVGVGGQYVVEIASGVNIISVSKQNISTYFVVQGQKISYNIQNLTRDSHAFRAGDRVRVSASGLKLPLPKLAGIYNTGYNDPFSPNYIVGNAGTVRLAFGDVFGKGYQYDFIGRNNIEFELVAGKNILSGGRISLSWYGEPIGGHRLITSQGFDTNLSATEHLAEFCSLPDIIINAGA